MSGYIVDDGEEIYKVVNEGFNDRNQRVTNKQRKRQKRLVKHIQKTWDDVESLGHFYMSHNVETNSLMKDIHKLFFMYSREYK
jgi:hypothetical protein